MGDELSRKEELVMLSVLNLGDDAYLLAIQTYLERRMGKKLSLASLHLPLSQLEKRGLLDFEMGKATAMRGGRRKKIYRVTPRGATALEAHRKLSESLWAERETPASQGDAS